MEDAGRVIAGKFVILRAVKEKNPVPRVADGIRIKLHDRTVYGPAEITNLKDVADLRNKRIEVDAEYKIIACLLQGFV